jgi:hypothetical protein
MGVLGILTAVLLLQLPLEVGHVGVVPLWEVGLVEAFL